MDTHLRVASETMKVADEYIEDSLVFPSLPAAAFECVSLSIIQVFSVFSRFEHPFQLPLLISCRDFLLQVTPSGRFYQCKHVAAPLHDVSLVLLYCLMAHLRDH